MTTTNNNEDLEKKIIEAAKELFIENGFAETSMSDIAAKVGINRPAFTIISGRRIRCFRPFLVTSYFLLFPKYMI